MPLYKYKVINDDGKKIQGTFNANSKNEVLAMIKDNGFYPIEVGESTEQKQFDVGNYLTKITTKDLAIMCRQFYTMLDAGSSMLNCLDILKDQTGNKKLKIALEQVYDDVQKGNTLSQSMENQNKIFPYLFINMVQAGEVSGKLDTIMLRMTEHYEKDNKINGKIKSAMVYPIILGVISISAVVFLLIFVMPTFVAMFDGAELPAPTRIVIGIGDWMRMKWYIAIAIIILSAVGIKTAKSTEKGGILVETLKLKIPIIKGTSQKVIVARFTRSLATILSSGIPLVSALEVVGGVVGNRLVQAKIMKAKDKVMKGIPLSTAISEIEIFPKMLYSMMKIGEESGTLDEILDKTANFYDDEVEEALQKLTTMIEPLMILIMGGLVGFIVIAMMLPMFDMVNHVQ